VWRERVALTDERSRDRPKVFFGGGVDLDRPHRSACSFEHSVDCVDYRRVGSTVATAVFRTLV
jgi:hypothetical protein